MLKTYTFHYPRQLSREELPFYQRVKAATIGSRPNPEEKLPFHEAVKAMVNGRNYLASIGFSPTETQYRDGTISLPGGTILAQEDFSDVTKIDELLIKIVRAQGVFTPHKMTTETEEEMRGANYPVLSTSMGRGGTYLAIFGIQDRTLPEERRYRHWRNAYKRRFIDFSTSVALKLKKASIGPDDVREFDRIVSELEKTVAQAEMSTEHLLRVA